jgi:hypothetical protein
MISRRILSPPPAPPPIFLTRKEQKTFYFNFTFLFSLVIGGPTEAVKKHLDDPTILDKSNRVILRGDYGTGKTFFLTEKIKLVQLKSFNVIIDNANFLTGNY